MPSTCSAAWRICRTSCSSTVRTRRSDGPLFVRRSRSDSLVGFARCRSTKAIEVAAQSNGEVRADLPPFQGGVAGMFGYELARRFERVPIAKFDEFALPTLARRLVRRRRCVRPPARRRLAHFARLARSRPARPPRTRCAATRKFFHGELASRRGQSASPPHSILTSTSFAPQFPDGIDNLTSNFSAAEYQRPSAARSTTSTPATCSK